MDFEHARSLVLNLLRSAGRAKNSEMIGLLGGDRETFERVREDLIFNDLAADKDSVGLTSREGKVDSPAGRPSTAAEVRVFLSYGRRDAAALVDRLSADLSAAGFSVWRDTQEIKAGAGWQQQIAESLREANVVVAVLSPHSVRTTLTADSPDNLDSICLAEISYALYVPPRRPLVPVMAQTCEPPLAIFHLDYVDMREWSQSDEKYRRVFDKLVDSIRAALRGEKRYRSWHDSLNPFDFSAFLHERRRDFTGRQWIFDRLDAWRREGDRERALLLTGDPGCGKSAIVAELVHRNPDGQVLAYHCCQWDRPETLRAWRMVRSLAAMVASKFDAYAQALRTPSIERALDEANCRSDPAGAFEDGLLAPLQNLPPPEGGPRYILIDALDESLQVPDGEASIVDVLATRLNRLPAWLRLVATTRGDRDVLDRLQGLRAHRIETRSPENAADLADFVRARLNDATLSARLNDARLSAAAAATQIIRQSDGNFLWAQQALDAIERNLTDAAMLDRLPPGLSGLYHNRLLGQFPDAASFARARMVFEIAVASREPLSEALLATASGLTADELAGVLREVSAYLPMKPAEDGSERYAIYHKSFADWLTDPKRRGSVHFASVAEGHQRLTAPLWREFDAGTARLSAYALAHLASHLIELQRWADVANVLTDMAYMEARTRAGQVFDLARDLTDAWQAMPAGDPMRTTLQLFDEALRRDIQFIHAHREDYPQALIQCLWNCGWWYDGSALADKPNIPATSADGPRSRTGLLSRLLGKAQPSAKAAATTAEPPVESGVLARRLEVMRAHARRSVAPRTWLRTLSPPADSLGSPQRLVLRGHKEGIIGVWFSPDGRLLSASRDGTICNWDTATGLQRSSLTLASPIPGSDLVTMGVAYSPTEGKLVRAAWVKKDVRRQNPETMAWETFTLADPSAAGNWFTLAMSDGSNTTHFHGGDARVMVLALGRGGKVLVLGDGNGMVVVLDPSSGALLRRFDVARPVAALTRVVGVSGRQADASDDDRTRRTRLLNPDEVEIMFEPYRRDMAACGVAVSADGARIACSTWSEAVHVWSIQSGEETHRLHGHVNRAKALAFSPDGSRLASGGDDYDIRIWDLEQPRTTAKLIHPAPVNALVYSDDGKRILSGAGDMLGRLWDAQTGQELKVLSGHSGPVTGVALSSDGRWAASGSVDRTVRLWDLQSNLPTRRAPGHSAAVTAVAFAPDDEWLASASEDRTIRIWDTVSGQVLQVLNGHGAGVTSLAIASDGHSLASTSRDDTIRIWDPASGRQRAVLQGNRDNFHGIRFIAGGARILCCSGGAALQVWNTDSRTKRFEVPQIVTHRTSHAVAPGEAVVAVATNEPAETQVWSPEHQQHMTYRIRDPSIAGSLVRLFDLDTGNELLRLRAHSESVEAIAFHPSAKQLATASSDQAIVWDLATGTQAGRLWGITNGLDRLAYSADGAHIIGAHRSSDKVWIWPSEGGAPLSTISGFGRFDAVVAWEQDSATAHAYVENDETVVASTGGDIVLARFPAALQWLARHPRRPVWAGAAGRHVHLLALEPT